jgi:MYXO-CTERM domain-containing protein
MRFLAALGALALVLCAPPRVLANGRYPEAQRLLEHPSDPNRLYLTGTYGLLLTEDRGANWYYVCESVFALGFLEGDPLFEVLADGTLVGGIRETLNRSTDCGCSWSPKLAEPELENVFDISLDSDGTLVALVQDITTPQARFYLTESTDRGETWQRFSELPSDTILGYTVDVAPSDTERLYASITTSANPTGLLLASDDRGRTWDPHPIPSPTSDSHPYIAAVSASDPDSVYVRTDSSDSSAEFAAQDALYVTRNAGESFEAILQHQAKLLGFALSPDGGTVLAGYGDPLTPGRSTNYDEFGIYKASTTDHVFERISDEAVSCLRWTGSGVYACVADLPYAPSPDLALGFAPNSDFTLATADPLTPLLDHENVQGPTACTATACMETWSMGLEGTVAVCQALGAECDANTSGNTLTCPVDPGDGGAGGEAGSATGGSAGTAGASSGGASGATNTGGANESGSAGDASGSGGNAGTPSGGNGDRDAESGCGCRHPSEHPSRSAAIALAALVAATSMLRRKTRRRG